MAIFVSRAGLLLIYIRQGCVVTLTRKDFNGSIFYTWQIFLTTLFLCCRSFYWIKLHLIFIPKHTIKWRYLHYLCARVGRIGLLVFLDKPTLFSTEISRFSLKCPERVLKLFVLIHRLIPKHFWLLLCIKVAVKIPDNDWFIFFSSHLESSKGAPLCFCR